jgi:cytochrome b561
MKPQNSLYDQANSFGWISIILHWSTALVVLVLWYFGQSISYQPLTEIDARRSLHITIGLIAWLPLVSRIVWRIFSPHPRVNGQSKGIHKFATFSHYLMLGALTVMIVSGPLMAWALSKNNGLAEVALIFHSNGALLLAVLVILHVLGALKHLMFNDDETIARIFKPRKDIVNEAKLNE